MTNRPKNRGTAAETAVTRWARTNGFPHADRQPLRGNRDTGDITLCPGVIIEVKAHATAATGQPGDTQLAAWMAQTETERVNANAALGLLVVKRKGTTDPGRWWCYLTLATIADLVTDDHDVPASHGRVAVSMPLDAALSLLRFTGYGDPLTRPGHTP